MAPRGPKRKSVGGAQTSVEEPAAKRVADFLKRQGVTKASFQPVREAVEHPLSGLDADVRSMLLAMLPWSLAVPADQRREQQQAAVQMVDSIVKAVQTKLKEAAGAESVMVDYLRPVQAELANTSSQAEAADAEARRLVAECEGKASHAAASLEQAGVTLQEAALEESRIRSEQEEATSLKSELEKVLSGNFAKLKECDFADSDADSLLQVVMTAARKSGLEDALVSTLSASLVKRPRGAFDKVVIEQAEMGIQDKVAALNEKIGAAAPALAAGTAAVQAAQAHRDNASEEQAHAAEDLRMAQVASTEAAAAAETAKSKVIELDSKLAHATEALEAKQRELEQFENYNINLFTQLRDRPSRKAEAEEEENKQSEEQVAEQPSSDTTSPLAGA